jgi:hypothetical protein
MTLLCLTTGRTIYTEQLLYYKNNGKLHHGCWVSTSVGQTVVEETDVRFILIGAMLRVESSNPKQCSAQARI